MFVLYKYKLDIDTPTQHSRPMDWCADENDIDELIQKRLLADSADKNDYKPVNQPRAFTVSDKLSEGYVVADIPNFDPNSGPKFQDIQPQSIQYVRRYEKFDVSDWRQEHPENERKYCKFLDIVCRLKD